MLAELDFTAFQLDKMEKLFSRHLTTILVTLTGSRKSPKKPVRPALQPSRASIAAKTPQHAPRHPLSPSYTPLNDSVRAHHSRILSSLSLHLPSTLVGKSSGSAWTGGLNNYGGLWGGLKVIRGFGLSMWTQGVLLWEGTGSQQVLVWGSLNNIKAYCVEGSLEVKNPFSDPLHWELSSSLPFVKEVHIIMV